MKKRYYWQHLESETCGYEVYPEILKNMLKHGYIDEISKSIYKQRLTEGFSRSAPIIPKHVMIDLETMGKQADAAVVSIGAVVFDPRYGVVTEQTFYIELDYLDQNRCIDPETQSWWANQPANIKTALSGLEDLSETLELLKNWLPNDAKVWGNGSIFDIGILENAYIQHNIEIPWEFWNIRDCRTILDLYESSRGGFNKKSGGDKHNALHDAIYQANYINMMWNKILNT